MLRTKNWFEYPSYKLNETKYEMYHYEWLYGKTVY